METFALSSARLRALLQAIPQVRVALVGDLCVDLYVFADMQKSALSRETPHYNLPVRSERYALGAGGNVVQNLCALKPRSVAAVSVLGADWRRALALECLTRLGVSDRHLITAPDRVTPVYLKPYRVGYGGVSYEDPRIDFENTEPQGGAVEAALIAQIDEAAASADVVAVADQFANGAVSDGVRAHLRALAQRMPVIADSRLHIGDFAGCIVKPNELEAAQAVGAQPLQADPLAYRPIAESLVAMGARDVIVTLGGAGAIALHDGHCAHIPAVPLTGALDIVGAGDAFLAASALALGARASLFEAAALATLAAGVTVQKIGETGVASPEEILALYERTVR